jgi:hypothetical protein
MPKLTELPSVDGFLDDDIYVVVREGQTAKVLGQSISDAIIDSAVAQFETRTSGEWLLVPDEQWDITPASTTTITSSSPSLRVGQAVRYSYGGSTYYGIIGSINLGTSAVTILGPPLNLAQTLTGFAIGPPSRVRWVDFHIPGNYAAATGDVLAAVGNRYFSWRQQEARLVHFAAAHKTARSTTQPKVNVKSGSNRVSTLDSNNGVTLVGSGIWVPNIAGAVSAANYTVQPGGSIEVEVTNVGSGGTAGDLSVSVGFVFV